MTDEQNDEIAQAIRDDMSPMISTAALDSGASLDKIALFSKILEEESISMGQRIIDRLQSEGFSFDESIALLESIVDNSVSIAEQTQQMYHNHKED